MTKEIKSYIKAEAIISLALNFFINGMVAALIYHKADYVPTDTVSIAIDLTATCLFTLIISALFCRTSVRRTKTAGILETESRLIRLSGKLFRRPVLFGVVMGLAAAVALWIFTATLFALLGIYALPFGIYVAFKCGFAILLGGGATLLKLYSGMCKAE